jgi:hypothetical protein
MACLFYFGSLLTKGHSQMQMSRAMNRLRNPSVVLPVLFLCMSLPCFGRDSDQRPNIIFILADDLRWDETDYPFVKVPNIQRIAREGVRFENAFVTTPLCSPSRASFLTGQYAHKHGITDNVDRSPRSHELATFPRSLHNAGYETAFIGKWHMGLDDNARPGIDHWVSVKGQGGYLDPEFNVNGERKKIAGYFTDILNNFANQFLKQPHTNHSFSTSRTKRFIPILFKTPTALCLTRARGNLFLLSVTKIFTRKPKSLIAKIAENLRLENRHYSARSLICQRLV